MCAMQTTTNLPPHLQEKINQFFEKEWQYQQGAVFLKRDEIYAHRKELAQYFYSKAYEQAYSDIMQELGPVVSALGLYANWANWNANETFTKSDYEEIEFHGNPNFKLKIGGRLSREALKHLKERILNVE